jgi:hypothetical protein
MKEAILFDRMNRRESANAMLENFTSATFVIATLGMTNVVERVLMTVPVAGLYSSTRIALPTFTIPRMVFVAVQAASE